MMPHQTKQGGPISRPVLLTKRTGSMQVQTELTLQVLRHGAVDMRKDVRPRVVQRVVEVEYPGTPP